MKAVYWGTAASWLLWLMTIAFLWLQYQFAVLHPPFIPLAVLVFGLIASAVITLGTAGYQCARGLNRRAAICCGLAAVVPLLLLALPLEYTRRQWEQRRLSHRHLQMFVHQFSASIMEAQARYSYPNRIETDRLVMYYQDVDYPERDAQMMEAHVARLENLLGQPLRTKIYWIRGSLLGQRHLSFLGLALGSSRSPDWDSEDGDLDRHELAHAVLTQCRVPGSDPPMLLHEGWAETQSGIDSEELVARALEARGEYGLTLRDLVGPRWYHQDSGPVYTYGGAFAAFLIRQFGVHRFVKLYNRCRPGTFDADCRSVYGHDLDDLERMFWQDADSRRTPLGASRDFGAQKKTQSFQVVP